jgi:archaeosine-15-forming tRNA-guanine transglycosylase
MLRDPIFRSSGKKNPHVKVIIFDESTEYARLNKKIFDAIVVHDRLFDMTNEIIAY